MAQTATIFVDDQDSLVKYLCPSVNQKVAGSYYNNTWTTVKTGKCGEGWFQYTFQGTGIHVAASVAQSGSTYSVKIDDGPFISQTGSGSYDSPVLSDGEHTLTYGLESGRTLPVLDYLTVAAGPTTPLNGRTIAVDDTDSPITYSGSWTTTSPVPLSFDYSTSLFHNTAHWSSTVGDSFRFRFRGNSISVLGIVAGISSGGNITATYSLDGVSKTQSIAPDTLDSLPMVKLFHADVQDGDHTLFVNLTDIQAPRALGLDFIAYNATFPTLASIIGTASAATADVPLEENSKPNWGPKVAVAIGIVAGLAMIFAVLLIFWKRYRLRKYPGSKLRLPLGDPEKRASKPFFTL